MTTLEPGASDVLTQGFDFSPLAAALRASSPAPTITTGFEVLVQLVMAAIRSAPSVSVCSSSSRITVGPGGGASPRSLPAALVNSETLDAALRNGIRSWGRFGPARHGSTESRSRAIVSL